MLVLQLYGEPYAGSASDDTGVNGLEVKCRGPGMNGNSVMSMKDYQTFSYSYWTPWSGACPAGTAICSIMTKVEPDQGDQWGIDIDDAALTDAKMMCCDY